VHSALEAKACESVGVEMIVSVENNNFKFLRESAKVQETLLLQLDF
jgi:hypothetical protein